MDLNICDFCYGKTLLQVTGVNGELKEVECPKCHAKTNIPVPTETDDNRLVYSDPIKNLVFNF
jgi:hypothetical protein